MKEKVEVVEKNQEIFGLNQCCTALGLSKSSWYWACRQRDDSKDEALKNEILEIIAENPGYGRRRITSELNEIHSEPVNEKRVRRILSRYDLSLHRNVAKHNPSTIQTTIRTHKDSVNLVGDGRQFDVLSAFSTDFTELNYANGTEKAYLMAFIDIRSKWCPGWAIGPSANKELALRAWENAKLAILARRGTFAGVVVHHDMDPVYTGFDWLQQLLLKDVVKVSYSLRGAKDNSWIESFWGRFKVENRSLFLDQSTIQALEEVADRQLIYYNEERKHTSLNNRAPLVVLNQLQR